MAGEIQVAWVTAKTVYAVVRNGVGQVWRTDTHVFEAYVTANLANYTVALTEQGTASAYYSGTFPSQIAIGSYSVTAFQQVGGSPAEGDTLAATGNLLWNGTAVQTPGDVRQVLGTASAGAAGYVGIDWGHVNAPTTTIDFTNTTIKNLDNNPPGTLTAAQIATGVWQDAVAGDFTVASSIGKGLYTAGVVPGGSGGLFIAGTNDHLTITNAFLVSGGATFTNAGGDGFVCSSTGGNGNGLNSQGNGTGNGILSNGGSGVAANGIKAIGPSTGIGIFCTGGGAFLAQALSGFNGTGIQGNGDGVGSGIRGSGGATGNGIRGVGGATSGAGFRSEGSGGNANGGEFVHNGTGVDLQADIGGRILGNTATAFSGVGAQVDVEQWLAHAVLASSGNGIPDVNTINFGGTGQTGVDVGDALSSVEGYTHRQAMRLMGAVLCGTAVGGPTGTVFAGMGVATARVTSVDDASGNRSSVILSP